MTLSDLLSESSAYLDLDTALPTDTELDTRISFANQAVKEWATISKWQQLKKSITFTNAFATLPDYYFEDMTMHEVISDNNFKEITGITEEARSETDVNDKYYYIQNEYPNKYVYVNGMSGTETLTFYFQRQPSLFATLTDICEVPDPQYIKMKIISYVLQSRNDERFPIVDAEARRLLQNMMGREMVNTPSGAGAAKKVGTSAYAIY